MSREAALPFPVGAADEGRRLDVFVGTVLAVSHTAARRLIADGCVRVDGRLSAKGALLRAGQAVTVVHAREPTEVVAAAPNEAEALSVLYVDDALVAIDKPAGMPSHPLRPREQGTAANALCARYPECATASPDPREGGLGHRLDTDTSGVLVAARTQEAWRALRRALGADDSEKRYLAEVWGAPPDEGRVTAAIGRSGRRGKTVRIDGGRNPQAAETTWKVLGRASDTALVLATLHAGRAHQVRAHLSAAGFPIVGDDRYGGVRAQSSSASHGFTGLRLHAARISFPHPTTGLLLVIEAPAPAWAAVGAFRSPNGQKAGESR